MVIRETPPEIQQEQCALGIANIDFDRYLLSECDYLLSLKQEPLRETLRYDYVNALDQLKQCQVRSFIFVWHYSHV